MRADRLREVADAIERGQVRGQSGVRLDMVAYVKGVSREHPCGTAACVAGYTAMMYTELEVINLPWEAYLAARDSLDLSESEAKELFMGSISALRLGVKAVNVRQEINSKERLVPDALRWMADTGEINWVKALVAACEATEKRDER